MEPDRATMTAPLDSKCRSLRGVAYLDWSAREVAIAGALSGDTELISAYESGDPYLGFGKRAVIVPENATKQSHGAERDILKTCVLGVGYGMLEESLAKRMKRTPIFARDLLKRHRTTYSSGTDKLTPEKR